jgi:riboflavin biosynthesis pyrimidine reductase
MEAPILQLYPPSGASLPLRGLYLRAPLEPADWPEGRPFVYSNYVTSLDGRIAVTGSTGTPEVPKATANPRDWRLFQELAARADVLLTTGRYLRELAAGQAQDVPPLSPKPEFADLHRWRAEQGLPPQPDLAIVSSRPDLSIPSWLTASRRVSILLPGDAPPRTHASGAQIVHLGGQDSVSAPALVAWFGHQGYRRAYCVAGARLLHTLVSDGLLDALFLTIVPRLLGGAPAATILEGPQLAQPLDFELRSLYFDPHAHPGNLGQCLARYDRRG